MGDAHFANHIPRNLERLVANPVQTYVNSLANPTGMHAAI